MGSEDHAVGEPCVVADEAAGASASGSGPRHSLGMRALLALPILFCPMWWTMVGVAKVLSSGALMMGTPLELRPPAAQFVGALELLLALAWFFDRTRVFGRRVGTTLLLIFMGVSAAYPVKDCGCFGDGVSMDSPTKWWLLSAALVLHGIDPVVRWISHRRLS